MWFGDLVTMRWWDDLWLNESFAEYLAHRCCTEATQYPLWTEFALGRKAWGSAADQRPSTHPVAGNGAVDADAALLDFDGISYAKGAAVLQQLAAQLGDDVFLAACATTSTTTLRQRRPRRPARGVDSGPERPTWTGGPAAGCRPRGGHPVDRRIRARTAAGAGLRRLPTAHHSGGRARWGRGRGGAAAGGP